MLWESPLPLTFCPPLSMHHTYVVCIIFSPLRCVCPETAYMMDILIINDETVMIWC